MITRLERGARFAPLATLPAPAGAYADTMPLASTAHAAAGQPTGALPTVPLDPAYPAAQPTMARPSAPSAEPSAAPSQKSPRRPDASPALPGGASRRPFRVWPTLLHLAAYGLVGFVAIGVLITAVGVGLGGIFVAGLGVIVLIGFVYALFGVAWFETARVSALYRLDAPLLRQRRQQGEGFIAWLRMLGMQAVDGRMWRALGSFAVASCLGFVTLTLVQWAAGLGVGMLTHFDVRWIPNVLGILLSLAGIAAMVLLHRLVTVAIIGSDAKERELTEQVRETTEQRAGAVRAADVERTRIERDLHDGVQPRLVSVAMTLGLAQQQIDRDPAAAKALVVEAHTSTKAAITELRQLARGIYASVLDDRGLDAALSALAGRSHIPVQLDVRLHERCSRDAEAAVYFAIAESLTNAAKHSRASEARVVVRLRDGDDIEAGAGTASGGKPSAKPSAKSGAAVLWARVEDNGIGGARVTPGGGLDGVMNRVLAAGGTTRLDSPQGGPTALEVSVPCAF